MSIDNKVIFVMCNLKVKIVGVGRHFPFNYDHGYKHLGNLNGNKGISLFIKMFGLPQEFSLQRASAVCQGLVQSFNGKYVNIPQYCCQATQRKLMTVSTGEPYRTDSLREYEHHSAAC